MDEKPEQAAIKELEHEWGQQGGFFFDYRDGKFNEEGFIRSYKILLQLDYCGEEKISKKVVALIYSIPFFLDSNKDMVLRRGGSEMLCDKAIGDFAEILMEKLETP